MPDEQDIHRDPRPDAGQGADALDLTNPRTSEEGDGVSAAEDPSPHDEHVEQLLQHTIDVPVLASVVDRQEAPDAADTLEKLEEEEAAELLQEMEDERAADALAEMEPTLAVGVIEGLIDE
ncbi:MAG: hypothetical protein O7G85_15890, partial [Planctomycetota bacterium]|nr:hypothetical protein [Planctomycetota bacterium]